MKLHREIAAHEKVMVRVDGGQGVEGDGVERPVGFGRQLSSEETVSGAHRLARQQQRHADYAVIVSDSQQRQVG